MNGHVYPQLDRARLGASAGYRQRKLLYRNRGDGTFEDVTQKTKTTAPGWSTSAGWFDYDRDGRLDLFVAR